MSGLYLQTGVTGSVVGDIGERFRAQFGGGDASTGPLLPPRTAVPSGPASVSTAAFGVSAGGGGSVGVAAGHLALAVGAGAVILLWCMWTALPR